MQNALVLHDNKKLSVHQLQNLAHKRKGVSLLFLIKIARHIDRHMDMWV